MDSQEEPNGDDHRHNAVAENSDTMALHKKRARRVSFAEMTSIHFFDRDDEVSNETPLAQTARIDDDAAAESGSGGQSERNREPEGEDDGDEDDEEMEMRRTFLRPIGSPSPGGSTFGSASSNDEDNFFGPVSAHFIRPGRLSDSAASDDNHDVTMDSTAFSMHYRSLARSESGMDLKTSTGRTLLFEEKTPTNSNPGSSMVVTLGKKHLKKSSDPVTEVSGNHSSNDMSLVGEKPNKYDYDRLSPQLDAMLAEGRKNLLSVSVSDDLTSVSPKKIAGSFLASVDLEDNLINLSDSVRNETDSINYSSMVNGDDSAAQDEFGEANSLHGIFLSGHSPNRFSTFNLGAAANRDNHKPNSSPYQLSKNEYDTSLAPTSSPAKQQELLLAATSPSKPWGLVSPLPEQLGSLLRKGSAEHQVTGTSIQRSISKLELLEKSTFSSTFSAKIDKSTVKSLDFSKSPYFDNVLVKNHQISRINFLEDSVPEEQAASVLQSAERNFSFSIDHARSVNHLKEHLRQLMSGKSPNELSSKNIFADQLRSGPAAGSPSKITWSGNNMIRGLFTPDHNNKDSLMIEAESLFTEVASGEGGKATTPEFVSSPGRILMKKLSTSPGFQSGQSTDLLLQSQIKQLEGFERGQDSTSQSNLDRVTLSSETANLVSLSNGMNGELNSPFTEVNHVNLIELKATDNREIDNRKEIIGTTVNFSSPAKENKLLIVDDENRIPGNVTSSDFSVFKDNIHGPEARVVPHEFGSPSVNKNLDKSRLLKSLVEFPAGSPSAKVPDNRQPSGVPSPKSVELSSGLQNFSANKRNLELLLRDTHRTDSTIMGRSPKVQKGGNYDPETTLDNVESRTKMTGHGKMKWDDAYSKLAEDLKSLIFGSAEELDHKMIDVLEDKLTHQQRLRVYEIILHGVMPQNTTVHHDLQLEKIAEAKSLLHRVVFEKAKLQLKHVKRERLLKRFELLSSRMQESQNLGTNIASLPLETCTSNVQKGAVGDRSLFVNLNKGREVCHEKLTAPRQALAALDKKILNLTKTFHARCKMKAEPGIGDTIALVNDYLMKRASYRVIRTDMQMWLVHSVGSANGQHNIVLNYLDFIMQSTKIIVGPSSSARTSFTMNEANITKDFPNMDACIAFSSVFAGETVHKYIGARTLVQETQVTSSLLGSLLDVIEEVQLAQVEFQNLTQSSFLSPSAERLDLILSFFSFTSGRKVILTLDMSCLKRGIYPLEVLPLVTEPSTTDNSLTGPIGDEIRNAVKGIRSGYMRILRLCKCVSQVVQASTA